MIFYNLFVGRKEMQDDVYNAILRAYHAEDTKVHVIKAGVGSGKSYSYLKIMSENRLSDNPNNSS